MRFLTLLPALCLALLLAPSPGRSLAVPTESSGETQESAKPTTFEDLLSGRYDHQRVVIGGVVRSQRVMTEGERQWLSLELAVGGRRVNVNVYGELSGHPELIGTRVRVRGVALPASDARPSLALRPTLQVESMSEIEVLRGGGVRPFDLPVVTLNQVLNFTAGSDMGNLAHVRGVVTLVRPDGLIYLQDETRGLRCTLRPGPLPRVGELIDVTGFPEVGGYAPVLRDADWLPLGVANPPAAVTVPPSQATEHPGSLLTVRGRIVSATQRDGHWNLALEGETTRFFARVFSNEQPRWRVGDDVDITGVCALDVGSWEAFVATRQPRGFILLTREERDVVILPSPPWWTPLRVAAAATAVCAIVMGTFWLRSRRQMREDVRARDAARGQFAAVLSERNRMAREIHDALAQSFAGISVHLEVLNDRLSSSSAESRRHLDLARQLVREGLTEARRTVWALRSQALENHSVYSALERIGRQLTEGGPTEFKAQLDGAERSLPADVESDLLRIGQEALTNAVRHAQAPHLELTMEFQDHGLRLRVRDDGRGFESVCIDRNQGHFGLRGMRERAQAVGGVLDLHSAPGEGTRVELTVNHV